jgi:cytochrome c heme-lyase
MHLDILDLVFLTRNHNQAHKDTFATATTMADEQTKADACPVDHKTREAWLAQAKAQQQQQQHTQATRSLPQQTPVSSKSQSASTQTQGWTSSLLSYLPFTSPTTHPISSPSISASELSSSNHQQPQAPSLNTSRVVSSIPRTAAPGPSTCPANHERETGSDKDTGNWIYPSEKMFFDAMRRKGHDATSSDMKTVVPIHNAVNERAWKEIREWEEPYTGEGK